jgi:hypothetical protein
MAGVAACQRDKIDSLTTMDPPPVRCAKSAPTDSLHAFDAALATFLMENGYCTFAVREYNDIQALLDGSTTDFGPVVEVFADARMAAETDHTPYDGGYRNVAIVNVKAGTVPNTYKQLRFITGRNCLYLWHEHEDPNNPNSAAQWRAAIAPPLISACVGGVLGWKLDVTVQDASVDPIKFPADPAAYPPVARFVESNGKRPMIGVKCGSAWCVVGAKKLSDIPAPPHEGQGTTVRWTVPGWFDDQTLAEKSTGNLKYSVKLSIVPVDNLEQLGKGEFSKGAFVDVAKIYIPSGTVLPAKYRDKFHFEEGMNTIGVRADLDMGRLVWKARITNSRTTIYKRDVIWTDMTSLGEPVPGTARWAWNPNDEELWVRCDVGCCMIQPDS